MVGEYTEGFDDGYAQGCEDTRGMMGMFNDYLGAMRRDQKYIFGLDFDMMSEEELRNELRTHAYACIEEVTEIMGELQWKPWKKSDGIIKPTSSVRKVAQEGADVLHFLAHILNIAGVTDDILNDEMEAARAKNAERQAGNYTYATPQ